MLATAHCHRLRLRRGLCFKQLMQARCYGLNLDLRVPLPDQRLLLGGGHQLKRRNPLLWFTHHGAQQVQPVLRQAFDGGGVVHVAGVGQAGVQVLALLFGVQRQIELRRVLLPRHAPDDQPRQAALDALADRPLVVEQHLEQRAVAQTALRLQRFNQLLERQFLMSLRPQRGALDLLQQAGKCLLAVNLRAQHVGVDEETDQAFRFEVATPGTGHTDVDRRLTAVAVQHGLETGQQHHEQGHVVLLRQLPQTGRQFGLDGQFQARPAFAAYRRASQFAGQFKQRMLLAQMGLPGTQLALALTGLQPVPLPDRKIGVTDSQGRQLGRLPQHMGLIQGAELIDHDLHRPAVGRDVVHRQHQHVLIGPDGEQQYTQ